jgi:tRNA C32,U32 (ribose-2'-O)-methylase TrmJ
VTIDTNPEFPSLNLGSAVQIMAYELLGAALAPSVLTDVTAHAVAPDDNDEPLNEPLATSADRERYYEHLEQVLKDIGFLNPAHPRKLMRRLVRLYNRVDLTQNEINILRGILTAIETQSRHS